MARSRQLTLDQARKPTGHGGWRPGAGRPKGRKTVAHEVRESFTAREPLHVTLRVAAGVGSLRKEPVVEVVRGAIEEGGRGEAFRVVEFNVLSNHIHMVVEARGAEGLARGMQGLKVRFARGINGVMGRKGSLFAERYHARPLRSPLEVRAALRYVLLNARHHAAERGQKLARGWIDPYSSAPWFDGWSEPVRMDADWLRRLAQRPRPTAIARTWLLAKGWRRGGLLSPDDVPAAQTRRRSRLPSE